MALSDPDIGNTFTVVSLGGLPAGLVLHADGTWAGTTTGNSPGSYPITLRACDQDGVCSDASVTIVLSIMASPTAPTTTPPPTSVETNERHSSGPPILLLLMMLVASLLVVALTRAGSVHRMRPTR